MVNKSKRSLLYSLTGLGLAFCLQGPAFAVQPSSDPNAQNPQNTQNPQTPQNPQNPQSTDQKHEGKKMAFKVGVCVGEQLSSKGINITWPEAGKQLELDAPTKDALKSAVKDCIAQFAKSGSTPNAPGAPNNLPGSEDISIFDL